MTNNYYFFERIMSEYMAETGLAWYKVFDSDLMDEVDARIAKAFGTDEVTKIDGYLEWYNEMAMDL